MSIHPAAGIELAGLAQPTQVQPYRNPSASVPAGSVHSDSGTPPNQDTRVAKPAPLPSELPQDEVHVQRDSSANGEIVIQYVNQFGSVVLQVPSSQVLDVARAIEQSLEREAEDRVANARPQTGPEGDIAHGH